MGRSGTGPIPPATIVLVLQASFAALANWIGARVPFIASSSLIPRASWYNGTLTSSEIYGLLYSPCEMENSRPVREIRWSLNLIRIGNNNVCSSIDEIRMSFNDNLGLIDINNCRPKAMWIHLFCSTSSKLGTHATINNHFLNTNGFTEIIAAHEEILMQSMIRKKSTLFTFFQISSLDAIFALKKLKIQFQPSVRSYEMNRIFWWTA